jgi:broad specificity phosphatase PhoE
MTGSQPQRIFLIRHGESSHNKNANALSGVSDVPLTPRGEAQCRALRPHLTGLEIEAVFSSPLARARDSARLLFPRQTVQVNPGLRELDYGDYEGLRAADHPKDPIIQQWNTAPGDLTFPGGDHIAAFARDFTANLIALARAAPSRTLACVSHRSAIRLLAATVIGLDLNHFRSLPCDNASLTGLAHTPPGGLRLTTLNLHPGLWPG